MILLLLFITLYKTKSVIVCADDNDCTLHEYCDEGSCLCLPGYSGVTCEIENSWQCFGIDKNDPIVCNGHGTCSAIDTCDCYETYSGIECENWFCWGVSNDDDENVCYGHGTCLSTDNCECEPNYTSVECDIWSCWEVPKYENDVCSGNGVCEDYNNCVCDPGYLGEQCENWECFGIDQSDPTVCNEHGTCDKPNDCVCTGGYYGSNCDDWGCYGYDKDIPTVCSSHGICVSLSNCVCDEGYSGYMCHIEENWQCFGFNKDDVNVCCEGRGFCIAPDTCDCLEGYSGEVCNTWNCFGYEVTETSCLTTEPSRRIEIEECSTHGICLSPDNCLCTEGWSGPNCDIPDTWQCFGIDKDDPTVCSGHGDCIEKDVCSCDTSVRRGTQSPYWGQECEIWGCNLLINTDPTVCFSHGECVDHNICVCDENYEGDYCETELIPTCFGYYAYDENVCSGRGVCVATDDCNCNCGFDGDYCEIVKHPRKVWNFFCKLKERGCFGVDRYNSEVCSGHGECYNWNKCKCECGYLGAKCQSEKSEKWKDTHCPDEVEEFTCNGFPKNDPHSCGHNGLCINQDKCDCKCGYNGKFCQNKQWFEYWFC